MLPLSTVKSKGQMVSPTGWRSTLDYMFTHTNMYIYQYIYTFCSIQHTINLLLKLDLPHDEDFWSSESLLVGDYPQLKCSFSVHTSLKVGLLRLFGMVFGHGFPQEMSRCRRPKAPCGDLWRSDPGTRRKREKSRECRVRGCFLRG